MELDETFPLAQTESFDSRDLLVYKKKARQVVAWVKRLLPKQVFLVSEGEYGVTLEKELSGTVPELKVTRIAAKGSKPDHTVSSIIQRLS